MSTGTLYLIPVPLGEDTLAAVLPTDVLSTAQRLTHFIVEAPKTARAMLKLMGTPHELRSLWMEELNEHTKDAALEALLAPLLAGHDVGLMSEAGCPGVADPGANLVKLAHARGIRVAPLVGPSSILLALMGAGANGQKFRFNGYLPTQDAARIAAIRQLEQDSRKQQQAELFIETPYRNGALFDALVATLAPDSQLTVACDITTASEYIRSQTVAAWRKGNKPDLHKRPTVFVVYAA
ncbi:16S rRNA (cytidine1402-2'-O)-methyltransferase [Andreprevotia lacus DSM 23236]|jgi:16S rRNA (cytidine1402-2'-O)-methyltransferase|uniref:16S rRNA (Cytidine1402-2'-O)-methyltransferase n=1 Tax=Andreprevotia lacus DSM 23236 TaxID=1121001 RepID=A0A1W1XZ14_9NEIS|nr:SAM-dependent methyltransferase [Andreprevotia lacus]SMC29210.1 16S rRNA (cytidine1402-2'-O)-methyltransferase [Andreprevotia lacus DSM 23236]